MVELSKEAVLKELPFWEHLTSQQQGLLIKNCREKTYEAGDLIYSPAKECMGILLVLDGIIRIYLTSEDGKKATVYRLRNGDCCGMSMSCLMPSITFDVEVEAEQESRLLVIPTIIFTKLSAESVYVENFAYKIMMEKFSFVMEAMQQLLFKTLEQRVVTFLLDESSALKSDEIHITQEQLAESIGSAREAVTRILKQLAKGKMICSSRGVICLKDKPALYQRLNSIE